MADAASWVYLHPVGLDSRAWDAVGRAGSPLLGHDFPGHGSRAGEPVPDTIEGFADDLLAHHRGPLHLVGASLGGAVALHAALRAPERIESVLAGFTAPRFDAKVMIARADSFDEDHVEEAELTLARWFSPNVLLTTPSSWGVTYARRCLRVTPTDALRDTWQAMATHDLTAALAAIRVPTTVLVGTDDASVPYAQAAAFADAIPHGRLDSVTGPHMSILECPAAVRDALDRHIEFTTTQARSNESDE